MAAHLSPTLTLGMEALRVFAAFVPSSRREEMAQHAAYMAPLVVPISVIQIPFEKHPLHIVHNLVTKALRGEGSSTLQAQLEAVPRDLRNSIYFEVWFQATDPGKGGDQWGEHHALSNLPRLLSAIKA